MLSSTVWELIMFLAGVLFVLLGFILGWALRGKYENSMIWELHYTIAMLEDKLEDKQKVLDHASEIIKELGGKPLHVTPIESDSPWILFNDS